MPLLLASVAVALALVMVLSLLLVARRPTGSRPPGGVNVRNAASANV